MFTFLVICYHLLIEDLNTYCVLRPIPSLFHFSVLGILRMLGKHPTRELHSQLHEPNCRGFTSASWL